MKKIDLKLTKRDTVILTVLLALALAFAFWQLLLSPMLNNISVQREELELKEQELQEEELKLIRLDELRKQPAIILADVKKITEKYLLDNTPQFYYDKLNHITEEAGLKTYRVGTRLKTGGILEAQNQQNPGNDSLSEAIREYDQAMVDESASAEIFYNTERYGFNYLPVTYEVTEGDLANFQDFIQRVNDLGYTMYISEARLETDDEGFLMGRYTMQFISIERLAADQADLPDEFIYKTPEYLLPPAMKARPTVRPMLPPFFNRVDDGWYYKPILSDVNGEEVSIDVFELENERRLNRTNRTNGTNKLFPLVPPVIPTR